MTFVETTNATPARHAERILAAWESGDEPLLRQELRETLNLGYTAAGGLDEERLELLQALSAGMLRTAAPVSDGRRNPAVRRCLDLLAHLAQRRCFVVRPN
jgi:hypothetical protein